MVSQREIGEKAEGIAEQHLAKLGYTILDKNWHYGHLELDIIARDGEQLVIVEVKSRNGIRYEHPSEAVTNSKMKRIVEAADAYILKKDIDLETRFDVVTIIFFNQRYELEHFKDAFYPTL
ncbi:YraN family protein [Maribellus maritimus]|uniref:YraN family protein n=1 Tax=Maribellus maritimus TaxID=2870838 RepID=UPI001EEB1B28|nr:YraN family protein [Maribellus maritimus]MCG6188761.1 YraN family protein [Maribellus maritimus]